MTFVKKQPNSVPEYENNARTVFKPGSKVRVKSRHGTTGTGTIVDILKWGNVPCTMVLLMDPDTVYALEVEPGWPSDEERFPTTGVFGGEIDELITLN